MSEEKKTEVTEEVKEARELTEKELAQVSGGNGKFAYEVPFYKPELEWIEYLISKNDPLE
ncbi:MAG: bacteriocin [Eubacteriales bacterium]|nr:bacteriocin [Eubacteriales bacterium]